MAALRRRGRGLAIAGALAGALVTGEVQALVLCSSPVKYLIICCPKPCPVIDYAKLALHSAKNAVDKARIVLTNEHTETTRNTETSMGPGGPRATVTARECPIEYEDVVIPTARTRRDAEPEWGEGETIDLMSAGIVAERDDEAAKKHGTPVGLERLSQRNTADTVIAAETLAMWADVAAENAAKAGGAIAQAHDARDIMRRIAEIKMETTRLDELRSIARALRMSERGTQELRARMRDR